MDINFKKDDGRLLLDGDCPQCGVGTKIEVTYHSKGWMETHWASCKDKGNHLYKQCRRCFFSWTEDKWRRIVENLWHTKKISGLLKENLCRPLACGRRCSTITRPAIRLKSWRGLILALMEFYGDRMRDRLFILSLICISSGVLIFKFRLNQINLEQESRQQWSQFFKINVKIKDELIRQNINDAFDKPVFSCDADCIRWYQQDKEGILSIYKWCGDKIIKLY